VNDYSTPNSSRPVTPTTVSDFILLLQGVLDTYGNLPVRLSPDGDHDNNDQVADVVVFQETKSLVCDMNINSAKQMLIFTY
jgi:hypothetical protein